MHSQVSEQPIPEILPPRIFRPEPFHGAEIIFRGLVRNLNHGQKVVALSYDSFAPLAEKIFEQIAQEAKERWGQDLNFAIIHRTGRLAIGECAVVVAVSARHRQEAYAASSYVIENLKHRAPLWKKEHYEDGDSAWLEGHSLCGHGVQHAPHS